MSLNLEGLIPGIVLPMKTGGDLDEDALRAYVRWVAKQGPVALAVNVDTGEGPHLSHDEKLRVLEIVREEVSLPCIAGVAGPSTRAAVSQARDYASAGASALLVFPVPAFLSSPLDPKIPLDYHKAIAEVGLPLILFQLQPALGGVNYAPHLISDLASIDGVVAIKEASFDARRFRETVTIIESSRPSVTVLTGNDNFILESFILGSRGALIGFGAIMTREQVNMIQAWQAGRTQEALALGARVQKLADEVFKPPVANYRARLKEALLMLGVLPGAYVREPLIEIPSHERESLRKVLQDVGLLDELVS